MNFLGHAYFSPDDSQILAGNVMGDFFKGTVNEMKLPENLKQGLILHRNLDEICDASAGYKKILSLIPVRFGRYNGIIADMFIDHLLSYNWSAFSKEEFLNFTHKSYEKIEESKEYFPAKFAGMFEYMKRENWFLMYKDIENMTRALRNFETRRGVQKPISESVIDLVGNRDEFTSAFFEFMAEMKPGFENLKKELSI